MLGINNKVILPDHNESKGGVDVYKSVPMFPRYY